MSSYSNPSAYWESRLQQRFTLRGVGHTMLGPAYNAYLYKVRLERLKRAMEATNCQFKNRTVLEIGCGTGVYTQVCHDASVKAYTGVDITAVSVQNLAKRYPTFHFIQADLSDKQFTIPGQVDVILIADVLFHIVDDKRFDNAIANLVRSLKPGGHLILSDLLSLQTAESSTHYRGRSFTEYQNKLDEYGMEVKHLEPIFATLHPPMSVKGTSLLWRLYARVWRHGFYRIARWNWFDKMMPHVFGMLDKFFFLNRAGVETPNSKWLVAVKKNV